MSSSAWADRADGNDAPTGPPTPASRRRARLAGAVVALIALTAIGFYAVGRNGFHAPVSAAPSPQPSASRTPSTADIFQAVAPSVVAIDAKVTGGAQSGTGEIINGDGTILTALHVVMGASAIRVQFSDGTTSDATIAAADPSTDTATLTPATLPSLVVPAVLGNPGRIAVGDPVIAIGDPLGLTDSTTTGVVSGLGRDVAEDQGPKLSGLIQFDAAVNPGSSGGPLLNARGETIGVVVALENPTNARTFIGIGFAVPIGTAVAAGGSRAPQQ